MYIIVRSDIAPGLQLAQSCHANMPILSYKDMRTNIIGQKFNRLLVIREDGKYKNGAKTYFCQCECGGTNITSASHLRHGDVKSCGCLSKEFGAIIGKASKADMTGKSFGRLTVISEEKERSKNGTVYWNCRCICGNIIIVLGTNLRRSTRSCGCLIKEAMAKTARKNRSICPWSVDRNHYYLGAKQRNLEFNISVEDFMQLSILPCFYCGKEPNMQCFAAELREVGVLKNGIDRVDSTIGYMLSNCVSCCTRCNFEKSNQSYSDFIENTRRRYEYLKSKNLLKDQNDIG
ncbi:hypothetical protein UFOVP1290_527 [uncultured Caudovirales phage]|uniref:Uncharacterized protein n=1 Tax=uncultured Caudovirales phage TaxID=2100421 RepID=A0A6J5RRU4_9CAUD|nr:hypothetical protein UFOVP1290_527 [uncultured Caudovirales phage]